VTFEMLMPGATPQPQELDAVEPLRQVGAWGRVELSWWAASRSSGSAMP